mmetsp:Transcript_43702/g.103168  ORF Transcript_43702/g.103168 Transcript_43702/m.103168 type:complete len:229 (+) Transcript_43702:1435-2121(+)
MGLPRVHEAAKSTLDDEHPLHRSRQARLWPSRPYSCQILGCRRCAERRKRRRRRDERWGGSSCPRALGRGSRLVILKANPVRRRLGVELRCRHNVHSVIILHVGLISKSPSKRTSLHTKRLAHEQKGPLVTVVALRIQVIIHRVGDASGIAWCHHWQHCAKLRLLCVSGGGKDGPSAGLPASSVAHWHQHGCAHHHLWREVAFGATMQFCWMLRSSSLRSLEPKWLGS